MAQFQRTDGRRFLKPNQERGGVISAVFVLAMLIFTRWGILNRNAATSGSGGGIQWICIRYRLILCSGCISLGFP